MRKDINVAAAVRTGRGKNEARRLRRAGSVPAILYGAFQDPISVAVSPKEIGAILRSTSGANTIFNLAVEGAETSPAMIVDVQSDPIRGNILHADFKRIDLTRKLRVSVPVVAHGEAQGVKLQGGLLEVVVRHVDVECLPDEIPEHFDIDVSELMIGQSIRAGDLPVTGEMRLVSPPEAVLVHVIALRAAAEETPAEGAAATAEPEVVKKGKKEEEGEKTEKKK